MTTAQLTTDRQTRETVDVSTVAAEVTAGGASATTIRVVLPAHLRNLARVDREVALPVEGVPTQRAVLDALEAAYPMLSGTIRGQSTKLRRPLVRFFACGEDLSHTSPDDPLPERVASGAEPFVVIGAMAGG